MEQDQIGLAASGDDVRRPTWAERLAAKIGAEIDRLESGSDADADDDQEATGALIEFLGTVDDLTDASVLLDGINRRNRLITLRALYRLVAP